MPLLNEELKEVEEHYEVCSTTGDQSVDDETSIRYHEEAGKCLDRKLRIKQLEQEKELAVLKEKQANKRSWLDILKIGIGSAVTLYIAYKNRQTLFKQTKDICNFETTNTFTSSAGRHYLVRKSFDGKY